VLTSWRQAIASSEAGRLIGDIIGDDNRQQSTTKHSRTGPSLSLLWDSLRFQDANAAACQVLTTRRLSMVKWTLEISPP
jgi:hypothetical protein